MKLHEVRQVVRLRTPGLWRIRRLDACHTSGDFERLARRRLPRSIFDYVGGGADDEWSLENNEAAFRKWTFRPMALRDVTNVDLTTEVLGTPAAAPLGLAPTGYTRMISTAGETAVARAAAEASVPYVVSTMATTSLEDVAGAVRSDTDLWFQLYVWKDRGLTLELVRRAAAAGYRVLEIAVDTAVSGFRVRDVRNGITIPPQLTPSTVVDIAAHPGYWTRMLANPALRFANVENTGAGAEFTIEGITRQFDPGVTWDDVERIREVWPGKLVLKGPLGPHDAAQAGRLGVDGVHLSNHGGRQLDRTIAPIDLVRPVREATGEAFPILVDSGVRHGADIAVALAHGADACFIGRPYLWGLAGGGQHGVARVIEVLTAQLTRTLQLLGVTSIAELRKQGASLIGKVNS